MAGLELLDSHSDQLVLDGVSLAVDNDTHRVIPRLDHKVAGQCNKRRALHPLLRRDHYHGRADRTPEELALEIFNLRFDGLVGEIREVELEDRFHLAIAVIKLPLGLPVFR